MSTKQILVLLALLVAFVLIYVMRSAKYCPPQPVVTETEGLVR